MRRYELFRALLKKGFLFVLIIIFCQIMVACSSQQEDIGKMEETDVIEKTQEVFDIESRISNRWENYYKRCDNELERSLRKEAITDAAKYMKSREMLYPPTPDPEYWVESDPDFPESGVQIIEASMRDLDVMYFIRFTIWIEANGDGTYSYSNDYPKQRLAAYLNEAGISVSSPATIMPCETIDDELTNIKNSLFINYSDYMNISDCFDTFWEVCQKIQADEELLQADLSQKVRFGESDRATDLKYYQHYYPEHYIDFSSMTEEGVEELEKQVREEQLAFFKAEQPERYEAIRNGDYLSRSDYRRPYHTPVGFYAIGGPPNADVVGEGPGIRGTYSQAASYLEEAYQVYRENLIENKGRVNMMLKENWPAYSFHSWEWRLHTTFPINVVSTRSWSAICSDLYCMRFPDGYYYGCSNECPDMIFINNEYEPHRYSRDMEIDTNREWDKGRAYMFLFKGESPYGNDLDAFIEYLDSDRVQEKIEPVILEPAKWDPGNFSSVYHDFLYAEAETKLRNIAVYSPVAGEEKGEKYHWILLFEEYKDSIQNDSLYKLRNQIMQTFILLPYWYECRPGDSLEKISLTYTGDNYYVSDICKNPLNQISDPDRIFAGQRIELPLHLLLKKSVYDIVE